MESFEEEDRRRAEKPRQVFRYSLIQELIDPQLSPGQRGKLCRQIAEAEHTDAFGQRVTVTRWTLDRWVRDWCRGGFAALAPTPRRCVPRTPPELLELAVALKKEKPERTAAQRRRPLHADLHPQPRHRHARPLRSHRRHPRRLAELPYLLLMGQANDALAAEVVERGRVPVIVLDESHLLAHEELDAVRMITNCEMDSTTPFAVLMIGQPTLRKKMKLGVLAALDQRIAVRCQMLPMALEETASYVKHHTKLAGRADVLFTDDAVHMIHTTGRGLPRAVNNRPVVPDRRLHRREVPRRLGLRPHRRQRIPRDRLTIPATSRPPRPHPAPRQRGLSTPTDRQPRRRHHGHAQRRATFGLPFAASRSSVLTPCDTASAQVGRTPVERVRARRRTSAGVGWVGGAAPNYDRTRDRRV